MKRQRGAAAVEFAFVVILVIFLLFGLIEFGRTLFTWNSAVDVTRRGARTAAIVAVGDSAAVLAEMRLIMPELEADNVTIEYSIDGDFPGAACVRGTCRFVRVSVNRVFRPLVFFLPATIQMPPFSTTYPVEALGAT
ncbi:MAG: pilus assembly protein [Burkholderiaceae bacterium]|nr:pilus assembly protein [Burkholderiaceae bacterium]